MTSSAIIKKQLIIFDLDGVIVDSRKNMEVAWSDVQTQLGVLQPFESYFAMIGRPFGDIISILGLENRLAEIEDVYFSSSTKNIDLVDFYPGVEDTLLSFAENNKMLSVVTSKDEVRTKMLLDKLSAEFITIQSPRIGLRGKPAPDHLMLTMAIANVDPKDSVYIGDMDTDALAAMRAGVDYIHADWGYGSLPPSALVDAPNFVSLSEILK